MSKVNKRTFWEERYIANNTPWDTGEAAPAFVKYFDKKNLLNKKAAVLGCGKGHDAFYIASLKEGEVNESCLQVYGFDFSRSAVKFCKEVKEKNNIKNIDFYQADFFDLIKELKWKNYFDFVIEHTSLCATDPLRRKEYANLIKYLLKPNGKLVGLFFIRPMELGGPPFGSTQEEIKELFKNDFLETEGLHHEKCPHTFTGEEYFGVFEKRI